MIVPDAIAHVAPAPTPKIHALSTTPGYAMRYGVRWPGGRRRVMPKAARAVIRPIAHRTGGEAVCRKLNWLTGITDKSSPPFGSKSAILARPDNRINEY